MRSNYRKAISAADQLIKKIDSTPSLEDFKRVYLPDNEKSSFSEIFLKKGVYDYECKKINLDHIDESNDLKIFLRSGILKITMDDSIVYKLGNGTDSILIPKGTSFNIFANNSCSFILSIYETMKKDIIHKQKNKDIWTQSALQQ